MKRSSSIVLSVFMTTSLLLGACSNNGNDKNSSESASPGTSASATTATPVKLSITWWGTQPRHDATNKVLELYTKNNPNITFAPEYTGYDGYFSKLTMLAAANNMPDVFQWFAANDQYYQKGLVEPLDDYVNKGIIDLKNVSPNLVDTGKLDGKLYGIPLSTNAKGYYVDPAIYAKAGLTVPAEGYATWEDLEKDLVKLKAVTGAYGGDDVMDTNNLFPYYARQRGFSVYDQSGVTVDEKTYVSFYTMKKRLIKEGLIPPIDVVKAQKGIEDSQTVKGKAAISYVFNNQLAQIEKAAGKDLQLIPLPGPNQEKGYDVRAGLHFAISASSKHKEEAAKFINWFINDPDANKILNGERGVPVSSEIRNILGESADPVQKEIYAFQDKIAANSSKPDPMHPNNYTEIDALFKSLDEQILFDQISPEDAYKTFKEQVAKLLAK